MKTLIGSVVAAVVIVIFLMIGMAHVPTGSVGIEKHMSGEITEIPQGFHWVGFGVTVQDYPTYRQALGGKDGVDLKVGTSDQQELPVTANLNWNIDTTKSKTLYQSVGGKDIDFVGDTIVLPTLKNDINKVTHTYNWNDIKGNKQSQVISEIEKMLKDDLAKSGIEVVNFGFSYVGSPKGMDQSQQALASSELNTKKAEQEQQKAQIENQTKIMNAEAEAKANQIVQQSITPQLLQKWTIEKWNGQLPQVEGQGSNIINLK